MLHAVEEQTAADYAKAGMRDKLKLYLDVKLEKTDNVIGWWGVSIPVLPWNVVLIQRRITRNSIQYLHRWPRTTYQFKASNSF